MFSTIALGALAAHGAAGFGFGWIFFFLIPLFWFLVIGLFIMLGRRRWARDGWGPGYGHHGQFAAARSAESTLGERFANGDIDEKEYRARLEVLRANSGYTPPSAK